MTTTIKITELTNIGSNLASSTVLPVVNMSGTPTTQKTVLGNIANLVLAGAGVDFVSASKANIAGTVTTNAQPNITSVGSLTGLTVSNTGGIVNFSNTSNVTLGVVGNLHISGGTSGQVLTTNGSNVLSWTTVAGSGYSNNDVANYLPTYTGNVGANWIIADYISGNANPLTHIPGANVTGYVPNANIANTAYSVAAANISGLGNIATINLDGNASNILSGAGTWVAQSGGSNANTGNITFSNTTISTAQTLDNVTIKTYDTANSIVNNWKFDSTGNLNIPGDMVGPANANLVIYANAGVHDFIFGDDGTFYAPDNVVLGGSRISMGPGAANLADLTNAVFIASTTGDAYIQAVIENVSDNGSADWVALGHRGNDDGGWADMGFTSSGFNDANYTITGQGDGYVFVQSFYDGQVLGSTRGGNLVLATGENGTVNDIIFGTGGFLVANQFAKISHANNAFELTRANASLSFPDGTSMTGATIVVHDDYIIQSDGNTLIKTHAPIGIKTWTFGDDGNLTLPSNTSSINYANGQPYGGGGGATDELVNGDNSFMLDSDGNVVFQGANPGQGVDRGLVWDYGANANGVNSQVRQDNNGITVRAWTENSGNYSAPVNIVTNQDANTKTWTFDGQGNLTLASNLILPGDIFSLSNGVAFTSSLTGIDTANSIVIITVATNVFDDPYTGPVTISGVNAPSQVNGDWYYEALDSNQFQLYTDSSLSTPVDGSSWPAYPGGDGTAVGTVVYTDFTIQGGNVTVGGNDKTWEFRSDGNLILPGAGIIGSPLNSSLDPLNPNVSTMVLTPDDGYLSQSLVLDPTAPGHIHLRAPSYSGNIDEPSANIFLGGETSSFEVGYGTNPNVFIHSNSYTWSFNTDSNLTAPGNIITPNNFVGASLRTNLSDFNWSEFITNIDLGTTTTITLANNVFGDPWSGQVTISDVTGSTEANDTWWYEASSGNQFVLYTDSTLSTQVDSSAWGAYTGGGFAVTVNYGNVEINAQNITIRSDHGDYSNKIWQFNRDGSTIFPILTVDLHNGGNQQAHTLQFGDSEIQAVITGPTPAPNNNAQRLIIQGQRGTGGEGGDVYLWGGDSDVNGGDIKIYAGDADVSGSGGYINLDGGSGVNGGGALTLTGGQSSGGQGGAVSITPGYSGNGNGSTLTLNGGQGSGDGGAVNITAGYGGANGGTVTIQGGTSALGLPGYGNVIVNAGASSWTFDNTGNLTVPGNIIGIGGLVLNAGGASATATLTAYSPDGNTISFSAQGNTSNAVIQLYNNTTSNTSTWTFDNTGNLTAPGSILAQNIRTIEGAVHVGQGAGLTNQGTYSIAVGRFAGSQDQGGGSVAVGQLAGQTSQGNTSVAVGLYAGQGTQGANSVAVGAYAGQTTQGDYAIAIGLEAGNSSQGDSAVAIGGGAGKTSQGINGVAVGSGAGMTSQGVDSVAIGGSAGQLNQSNYAIAIGSVAGYSGQGLGAIAIGIEAGKLNQGANAIAIGTSAANSVVQPAGSIVITASGTDPAPTNAGLYLDPVRNDTGNTTNAVYYNTTTKEVTYGPAGGGSYGNSNVATFLGSYGSNTISTTGNVRVGQLSATATDSYDAIQFSDNGTNDNGSIRVDAGSNMVIKVPSNFYVKRGGSDRVAVTDTTSDFMATTNVTIQSNKGGTANVWTFDSAGNLTLPGNTFAVNYANGTQVSIGGGGSYGDSNVTTLLGSFGSNSISTTGNINAGNFIGSAANISGTSVTGVDALYAGITTTPLANTITGFTANVNSYTQVTLQNKSTGADATSDYIATADNGSDTVNYMDVGIINSGYDANTPTNSLGNIVYAADSYMYAQGNTGNASQSGGNLAIGTTVPGKNVKIFAGGVNNTSIVANIGNTGIGITGNVSFTSNTSNIVFGTTAYINGSGNAVGRDGSIMLIPYTGAGSSFAGVVIGGAGRLIAPNGSVHQVFNTSDVTFQVAVKTVATAATSTTTGGIQAGGGIGVVGNIYVGNSIVRTGAVTSTAWTTSGVGLKLPTATYTDNSTAAGTQASSYVHLVDAPALAFSNAVTVTNAATMYVAAPTAGTNATLTNSYAMIANGAVQVNGNITGNTNGFAIGYLNIPQVAASNVTLGLTDAGKHYYSTTAGNLVLTIPNNATTSFATGTAISIVVQAAGNILVNAAAGVTLYMAGNSTSANRVVGTYGMATLMKVASDTWFINGTGVS